MCCCLQFFHRYAGYSADFFTIEAFFEQRLRDALRGDTLAFFTTFLL